MRIAIPTWAGTVSPVFDVARSLLLLHVGSDAGRERSVVPLPEPQPLARAALLRQLGVDVLLCGAISVPMEQALASSGICVIPYVCGSVEEVLGAYLSGRLTGNAFLMPGCRGRGHRRGRRRGGGRGVRLS